MPQNAFFKLFVEELQDLYSAEKQIIAAFPDLINAVSTGELREAFQAHFEETKNQVKRLDKIFNILNVSPGNMTCKAMQGLIDEVKDFIHEDMISTKKVI